MYKEIELEEIEIIFKIQSGKNGVIA